LGFLVGYSYRIMHRVGGLMRQGIGGNETERTS
jgi:hypothetical protein